MQIQNESVQVDIGLNANLHICIFFNLIKRAQSYGMILGPIFPQCILYYIVQNNVQLCAVKYFTLISENVIIFFNF